MAITHAHNGLALDRLPFELYAREETPEVASGVRIGITKAAELPWRMGSRLEVLEQAVQGRLTLFKRPRSNCSGPAAPPETPPSWCGRTAAPRPDSRRSAC